MRDIIYRDEAINLLRNRLIETANNNVGFKCDAGEVFEDVSDRIICWFDELPSAQSEIIRCKECMHNGSYDTDCPIDWNGKEYCSFAERKEDEYYHN